MPTSAHLLPLACGASGIAWALLSAWRAGPGAPRLAARALLGGVAAVFLAGAAYDLAGAAGISPTWQELTASGRRAVAAGLAIGLVEEGAKLAGLLLAVERGWRRRTVAAATVGVAAGFAALEAAVALRGAGLSLPVVVRIALAPAAHAALAAPFAIAVAAGLRRGGRAWLALPPALLVSALLHGAGDLSLALPGVGRGGYALALLVPVLAVHLLTRAPRPAAAPRRDARPA
jgi:RsiW-degrading membrane proteinase PrsW (M82 family)